MDLLLIIDTTIAVIAAVNTVTNFSHLALIKVNLVFYHLLPYTVLTGVAAPSTKERSVSMFNLPEHLNFELAKIWLEHQDLNQKTPEQVKELFFDAFHRIEKKECRTMGLILFFNYCICGNFNHRTC